MSALELLAVLAAAAWGAAGHAQSALDSANEPSALDSANEPSTLDSANQQSAFESRELVPAPTQGWPTNGGNLYNQRYSPLTEIDRGNISRLQGVWRTRLGGSGLAPQYSGEAQPIVHDGVMYVSTGADDVFALSVATGEILWSYHAELDPGLTTVCCGWTSRGVAIGDGKVFFGRLDGQLVALDQHTGKIAWAVQAERWQDGFSITSAPLFADGKLITGFSGAEFGVRGRVKAFDADDGRLLWTFYTIPGPGEKGHDTWPADNDAWKKGGATVWQTPAYDPELGLIYFSTGNPGPDFNGAGRAGDNLFTSSIVAVDVETGEYRWHFQQVHHDLWDYDAPNPVVLFDAPIGGRMRRGLVEVSKTGWAYILDRETGEPLIGIDERPVPQEPRQATAATQPYPRGDAIVPQSVDIAPENFELVNGGRIFTPFFGAEGRIVSPSLYGGANWPPSSYDPKRRLLFVCASDVPGNYTSGERALETPADGEHYEGSVVGFAPLPRMGIFAALDVTTNRLAWRYRWHDQCYSGSVATAGGLVFVGRSDGRFTALDSDTGRTIWSFQTGAGVNAPASVFEYDGREYVAVLSAGNVLVGAPRGDSVWLFALDGGLGPTSDLDSAVRPPTPGAASAAAASAADAAGTSANGAVGADRTASTDLAAGKSVFQRTCVPCHGDDGLGGHGGGAPLDHVPSVDFAVRTITDGVNNMPAFGGALSEQEIRDVSAYVVTELFPK